MKRKILAAVFALAATLCLCFGLAACGGFKTEGIYYLFENEEYDFETFFEIKDGKWTDETGASGEYEIDGETITFYSDLFGQRMELTSGTIKDGVLTMGGVFGDKIYAQKGAAHIHEYGEWVTQTPSTCTEHGTEVLICKTCGKYQSRSLPLAPHPYGEWEDIVPATCTEGGMHKHICTACSHEESEPTQPLGHEWDDGIVTSPATCEDDGEKLLTCMHDEQHHKTEPIPALGHEWDDGIVTKSATCEDDGEKFLTCKHDEQHHTTEIIPALGHEWDDGIVTKSATCEDDGEKLLTCKHDEQHHTTEVIPALGHEYTVENKCVRYEQCGVKWEYTEGLAFALDEKTGTYTVTGIGSASGDVVIPCGYQGKFVTSIKTEAFRNCGGLTSVTIPDSVTSIGTMAFYGCDGLTRVNITDLAAWRKIDFGNEYANPLSYAHHLYLDGEEVTTLTIPEEITEIKDYAFYGCEGLTGELKIPDSVTSIGRYAFSGCSGLTGELKIPDGVTSMGAGAFSGCDGLASVTIPDSVTSIGDYAFSGCSGLTRVDITDFTAWCRIDFGGLSANPLYYAHLYLDGEEITTLTIPEEITEIKAYAFSGCDGLASVTIPDSVTSIGSSAFAYCDGLTSVTIPDSVTSIGSWAFQGCSGLTRVDITDLAAWCKIDFGNNYANPLWSAHHLYLDGEEVTTLTIPEEITEIKDYAFYGCEGLTGELKIPDSVTSIGDDAFSGCSGLTGELKIPDSVTSIGAWAFMYCKGLTDIKIPDGVTAIEVSAFNGCSGLTGELKIPDSVTSIEAGAFSGCSGLTSIIIPEGVTEIGDWAFRECTGLMSVVWNAENSTAGSTYNNGPIFYHCTNLKMVTFGEKVKKIPIYAFYGCTGLTSVTIPDSVTEIGNWAFSGCFNLLEVWNHSGLDIQKGADTYGGVAKYAKYVYTGNEASKQTVTDDGYIFYEDGAEVYLIKYCGTETALTLPAKSPSGKEYVIYQYAFYMRTELTSVTIGSGVTEIGQYAFWGCTGLTSATIESGVIGRYAFSDCTGLTSVTIGRGVTSIGSRAFDNCTKLTDIQFKGTVAEWQTIKKGGDWNYHAFTSIVTCTNGKIDGLGNVTYF